MPPDEYDWMTTAEAIERIEALVEAEAAEAHPYSPFVLETSLQFSSPFSLALDVVALRKALAALREQLAARPHLVTPPRNFSPPRGD